MLTAKASLAGTQPLPHLSPCSLLAEAHVCLVVAGRENESCMSFHGSLIPDASASGFVGFFLYLAYGNSLPVAVSKMSIKLKEAGPCSLCFGKSGKCAQLGVLRESPTVHRQGPYIPGPPAVTSRCP